MDVWTPELLPSGQTVWTQPVSEPVLIEPEAPPPLSPNREALRSAIAALAAGQAEVERRAAPLRRLHEAISRADQAEAEARSLRDAHGRMVAEWIAGGCDDARPQPSPALVEAERRAAVAAGDAAAARSALAEAERAYTTAATALRPLQSERDIAAGTAAIDAARRLAAELTRRLEAALAIEAQIQSVADELQRRGDAAPMGAPEKRLLGCAAMIRDVATAARRAAGVPVDGETGRRLLDRLANDAEAEV